MYLTVKNQNIYYQKVGEGKNLILLHGFNQDVSSFWGLTEDLKDEFTIWMIDLPGFGKSDAPQKAFFVKDYAEVIKNFIEENKIKNPILLGHSLGGRVAIKFASNYGALLDKLILEDAAGIKPEKSIKQKLSLYSVKIFKYLIPNFLGIKKTLRKKLYQSLDSDYLDANDQQTFRNIVEEDLTEDLKKITTKTLILWGEKDKIVPLKYGKKIYQLIKDSKLEVIDDVGHFPHLENRDMFVYWIRNFYE